MNTNEQMSDEELDSFFDMLKELAQPAAGFPSQTIKVGHCKHCDTYSKLTSGGACLECWAAATTMRVSFDQRDTIPEIVARLTESLIEAGRGASDEARRGLADVVVRACVILASIVIDNCIYFAEKDGWENPTSLFVNENGEPFVQLKYVPSKEKPKDN